MKLKMYLRGLGIGMIITAIVMGIALGGRGRSQATMTDEEIIARARELGMEDRATLMQYAAANSASSASLYGLDNDPGSEDEAADGEADALTDPATEDDGSGSEGEPDAELVEVSADGDAGPSTGSGTAGSGSGSDGSSGSDAGASTGSATDNSGSATAGSGSSEEEEEMISVNGLPAPISAGTGAASSQASSSTSYFPEDDDNAEQALSYREDTEEEEEEEEREVLTGSTVVTIPKGVSSETASSHLAQAGVVDDAIAFNSFLIRNGYDRYIQSGTKQIPRGASYDEVARIITGRR